ncbi:uroporphyrinogen-III synthase [Geodermatophilus bullaregiensis]|uniref:uroporphyrinogen-III synthase n=1 Tax=Geodermatophilus bullaregiensis TaxID=1564160 RepID=UPI0027DC287A|nr:uroporphyrinogen-III synthase [Geodermatophilus bullaregiensis]MBM7804582.1 uroporphyrinogen-III synthase [Geodermatophilus bullaregiensis]
MTSTPTAPEQAPAPEQVAPGPAPLAGYTVAVTAARRREELGALLDRRGARVVYAPAIRIVPLADDAELVAATEAVLAAPVDLVVATTGVGFRGWLEAADAWDLPLVEHLRPARVLARGPKARGAIRGGGLVDAWSPPSESSAEVLEHLLSGAEGPLAGRRIAVQLHGDPLSDVVGALRAAGAEVLTVPVYRWVLPEDVAPLRRLVGSVVAGAVDAVTFTSAPAAASLLRTAADLGLHDEVVAALTGPVLAVAVGATTAGPLTAAGVPTVQPERSRLGALAREVVARLPERDPVLRVGGADLQVRGYAAVLDGRLVELPPGSMAVLRALAARPGTVVAKADLVHGLPGGGDGHAVEMAVTRLRAALGPGVVETVVKRGYRLAP